MSENSLTIQHREIPDLLRCQVCSSNLRRGARSFDLIPV
jgi:hypothetical protein